MRYFKPTLNHIISSEKKGTVPATPLSSAFNKEHGNVIKSINRVLSQVSDSLGKVNFNVSEYEKENILVILLSTAKFCAVKKLLRHDKRGLS